MSTQNPDIIRVGADEREWDDRSRRYFGNLYTELQRYPVLVVGAGAVGTELVKNLVMVGVRRIHLVDFDKVSATNLNRCVFFRPGDHNKIYKVDAIAREVKAIWPEVELSCYAMPIQDAPEEVWQVPLVLVAVDNNEARYHINLRTLSNTVPPFVINGALGRTFCEVQALQPGTTACLVCTWTSDYLDRMWKKLVRQNCDEFFFASVEKFPAISFLNSLTGAMMASEAIKILLGFKLWQQEGRWQEEHVPIIGQVLRYDIRLPEFSVGAVYVNPQCPEIFCRTRRSG
jgi:molybdopterin/thiamine biosynthesis adenylyltransferase